MTFTILIVDDEPDAALLFQQNFRREIRRSKIRFFFEQSGEGALAVLKSDKTPSVLLVLSDINMPGMSGMELLVKVKSRRPSLPVIMITAYGDERTAEEAVSKGADRLISKPLDFIELRKTLSTYGEGLQ